MRVFTRWMIGSLFLFAGATALTPSHADADVSGVFVQWVKIQNGAVVTQVASTIGGTSVSPCGTSTFSGVFYGAQIESVRAQLATALVAGRRVDVIAAQSGSECIISAVVLH